MKYQWAQYYTELIHSKYAAKFQAFYNLLCFYNEKYNLTRIIERKDCDIKHFLDSICAEQYFPSGARVAEIGSGAGFPSIPLKIIRDDLKFTLVESVGKKCDFLREAVKELALNDVEVINMRAEDGGKNKLYREQYDVCCARAVARLNTLSEYCIPYVKKGGAFIAYKGDAKEEISEAENAFFVLGAKIVACEMYELPEAAGKRTLIVAEKYKPTDAAYPRGKGKERSKPL